MVTTHGIIQEKAKEIIEVQRMKYKNLHHLLKPLNINFIEEFKWNESKTCFRSLLFNKSNYDINGINMNQKLQSL